MRLVFVSTGRPHMAADFRATVGLRADLWLDPRRSAYRHLGFKRSVRSSLFNLQSLRHGLRALKAGFRQGRTQGDPWQQGGVVVVDARGRPVFAYASAEAGDHPKVSEVLAAVGRAA